MVRKIVEERKKVMIDNDADDEGDAVNDVLDALLRDKGDSSSSARLSPEMISQNIIEMMIPGEETLPTAMTMALKFLSDSPLALSKLQVRSKSITCYVNKILLWCCSKTKLRYYDKMNKTETVGSCDWRLVWTRIFLPTG